MVKIFQKDNAFSVMEILIVIILLSVIVVFALPSLNASRRRSFERIMIKDAHIIHSALQAYRSRFGKYPDHDPIFTDAPSDCTQALNETLGLNIVKQEDSYEILCAFDNSALPHMQGIMSLQSDNVFMYLFSSQLTSPEISNNNPCCIKSGPQTCELMSSCGMTDL